MNIINILPAGDDGLCVEFSVDPSISDVVLLGSKLATVNYKFNTYSLQSIDRCYLDRLENRRHVTDVFFSAIYRRLA